jgi:hypothetical protein
MLPGFPLLISAEYSSGSSNLAVSVSDEPLPVCTQSDILESSLYSALENGRWVVKEKMMIERSFSLSNHANTSVSLDGYQRGTNSLGIHMDYRPTKCSLLDQAALQDGQTLAKCQQHQDNHQGSKPKPKRRLHIVLAGDSNLRLQADVFAKEKCLGAPLGFSLINTQGGINDAEVIALRKEVISWLLERDAQQDIPTSYVVIFNSGLHDIGYGCGSEQYGTKIDYKARGDAPCVDTYRRRLKEFAQDLQKLPSVLTVFQTSTAAWPKWGVYGAAWLPNVTQALPFTPDFAHHFNEIAWEVMKELDIPVMDAWLKRHVAWKLLQ